MIVSSNPSANTLEFEELLNRSTTNLERVASAKPQFYLGRKWEDFETDVHEAMKRAALGGSFDGSIELLTGKSFPDIVANKLYGVEVKSIKTLGWKTLGGSVNESTRARDLDRIYLMFGKLSKPVQFRWRKYDECLSDVKVTHSPRYEIDLETEAGSSVFDKMGISYEEMRSVEKPLSKVLSYMRGIYRAKGEEVWWMDDGSPEPPTTGVSVRLWKNLSPEEKSDFRNAAMALFPEIFGRRRNKYSRVASWLAARHGVVSHSLRDTFTAKGQVTLNVGHKSYCRIPRIFGHLQANINDVIRQIETVKLTDLAHYWETKVTDEKRRSKWVELLKGYAEKTLQDTNLDIEELINNGLCS